jgi:CBS domain-containing protein
MELDSKYIIDEIQPLSPNDNGLKALERFDEFRVYHLPVVEKGKFLGLVSEQQIFDLYDAQSMIKENNVPFIRPILTMKSHIYEVLHTAEKFKLSIIPIVDEEENYLGYILTEELLWAFVENTPLVMPGGVLTLEMNRSDYSMAEISRIVESNDVMIVQSHLQTVPNSETIYLYLKLNKVELSAVIQNLTRYGYKVSYSYQESVYEEDMKRRLDSFIRYISW